MATWASLYSGGKDSSYALYRALATGRDVGRLVTVHPPEDSYLYHVPATRLAALAAESVGIPLLEVEATAVAGDREAPAADVAEAEDTADVDAVEGARDVTVVDSSARGDAELEPLEAALADLADEVDLAGVTAGAVESEFQASRLRGTCDRLGIELYAPLWRRDPVRLGGEMLDAGFEITVVQVAADGLDSSWLGRTLDRDALAELEALNERRGVHVLGEGGEYETLVTDGPHMDRRIGIEYDAEWEGGRGRLRIRESWLD